MQATASRSAFPFRRAFRIAFAIVFGLLGLMLLMRTGLPAGSLPFLFFSVQLAFPGAPPGVHGEVRDLLDSTAEVRPLHVALGFAVLALVLFALSFSGPFWSWLTDRIPYAPPRPYLLPTWSRVAIACAWLAAFSFGLSRTFRAPVARDATLP